MTNKPEQNQEITTEKIVRKTRVGINRRYDKNKTKKQLRENSVEIVNVDKNTNRKKAKEKKEEKERMKTVTRHK